MACRRSAVRSRLAPPAFARAVARASARPANPTAAAKAVAPKLRSSEGGLGMKYVYLLECIAEPERHYTGLTDDVPNRLDAHNRGQVSHTSKFRPWRLKSFVAFADEKRAVAFEK